MVFFSRLKKSLLKNAPAFENNNQFVDIYEFQILGQNLMTFFFILGDDSLQLEELERVMGECLRESGLELPEIDVQVNIDH